MENESYTKKPEFSSQDLAQAEVQQVPEESEMVEKAPYYNDKALEDVREALQSMF